MFRDCSKKKSKENVQLRVKISRSFPGFSENMVNKARINVLNEARERRWTGGYRNKKNSLWGGKNKPSSFSRFNTKPISISLSAILPRYPLCRCHPFSPLLSPTIGRPRIRFRLSPRSLNSIREKKKEEMTRKQSSRVFER